MLFLFNLSTLLYKKVSISVLISAILALYFLAICLTNFCSIAHHYWRGFYRTCLQGNKSAHPREKTLSLCKLQASPLFGYFLWQRSLTPPTSVSHRLGQQQYPAYSINERHVVSFQQFFTSHDRSNLCHVQLYFHV